MTRLIPALSCALLISACGTQGAPDRAATPDPIERAQSVQDVEKLVPSALRPDFDRLMTCKVDLAVRRKGAPPIIDGAFAKATIKELRMDPHAADACSLKLSSRA